MKRMDGSKLGAITFYNSEVGWLVAGDDGSNPNWKDQVVMMIRQPGQIEVYGITYADIMALPNILTVDEEM